ncbi:hypothetical protein L2E82_08526 [Cichorium intybus]|uniref:Uncharacterized protein n=1 Tax=Cichorium intybus TaxID=13427 RepID=A0ACB9G7L8_CICIN|nr:hypothetical protein L2E82_08526 [Cichorium intybus]
MVTVTNDASYAFPAAPPPVAIAIGETLLRTYIRFVIKQYAISQIQSITNIELKFHSLANICTAEAKKIWEDIRSGKAEEDSYVLSRFLLISFADLKKFNFHYWFAFPALVLDPPATLVDLNLPNN